MKDRKEPKEEHTNSRVSIANGDRQRWKYANATTPVMGDGSQTMPCVLLMDNGNLPGPPGPLGPLGPPGALGPPGPLISGVRGGGGRPRSLCSLFDSFQINIEHVTKSFFAKSFFAL